MTVADLIQRFPRRREIFPGPIEQDINLAEFLANGKQQEDATLAGLDHGEMTSSSYSRQPDCLHK